MTNKYNIDFPQEVIQSDISRLTNQLWKLIPMRENKEDWLKQLDSVLLEISGLNEIFENKLGLLELLSKLEGMKIVETEFDLYRKTVFESISLLQKIKKNEYN